jgi:hypothetical protein
MTIKSRWDISDDEQHAVNLNLQKCERQMKRLKDLDKISASLVIRHQLDSQYVSDLLGLTPDDADNPGAITNAGRWEICHTAGHWRLSSDGKAVERSVEGHLRWIVNQIAGRKPSLRKLQTDGAETYVSLHLDAWLSTQYVEIDVEISQLLASYGLPLRIFFHYKNAG